MHDRTEPDTMDEVLRVLELYPSLIPNSEFKIWNGTIFFKDKEIPVTISTPNFSSLRGFSLVCSVNDQSSIEEKLKEYQLMTVTESNEFIQFLDFLRDGKTVSQLQKNIAENIETENRLFSKMDKPSSFYNNILNELNQLENQCILTCRGDLSEISMRIIDIQGMEHQLVVRLPPSYPTKGPIIQEVDLPDVILSRFSQDKSILKMFHTFQASVESLQNFWAMYKDLEKNTWVIDPERRQFKDTHCRIVIGDSVSMLITFNPQDVVACPDIKFLGPEYTVIAFMNKMERNLKSVGWNENTSVLDNLLTLLDLSHFPQPDIENTAVPEVNECSICFTKRLDNHALPTKVCNNVKCNCYFHIKCLAEWFQAVPTNETSFNLISGDCPSCGEKILCPT